MKALFAFFMLLAVTACSPSPPPNSAASAYFLEHQALIEELAQLGVTHPALRWIEPSQKKYPSYYSPPSQTDLAAEKRAYEFLALLKADYVAYWHDGSMPGNPLVYVEIPLYRWGLSLGGYSKSLRYFPGYEETPPKSENGITYVPLSKRAGISPRWTHDECLPYNNPVQRTVKSYAFAIR